MGNLEEGDTTIFGVSEGVQEFFNTGLLGALVTTIIGSITWQLAASAFPLAFLSNPLVYVFLRICLFLEWTGICSGAWVLAAIHKKSQDSDMMNTTLVLLKSVPRRNYRIMMRNLMLEQDICTLVFRPCLILLEVEFR